MDEMILKALTQYGVPTVICFFLLIKGFETLNDLKESVKALDKTVALMKHTVEQLSNIIIHEKIDIRKS